MSKERRDARKGPHAAFFGWGYIGRWWSKLAKLAGLRRAKRRERREWKKEIDRDG